MNSTTNTRTADAPPGSLERMVNLPRGPWVASCQYGMHFILSQDNEILWRCDWMPMPILRAMVDAANKQPDAQGEPRRGETE